LIAPLISSLLVLNLCILLHILFAWEDNHGFDITLAMVIDCFSSFFSCKKTVEQIDFSPFLLCYND